MRTAQLLSAVVFTSIAWLGIGCGTSNSGGPGGGGGGDGGGGSGSSAGSGSASGGIIGNSGGSGGSCLTCGGPSQPMVACAQGSGKQCQDPNCPAGSDTTISGQVFDPAGANPVYGVAVYVPSTPLQPLPQGVSCNGCADLYSGTPIAATVTDADGKFKVPNAPHGMNVPLVVQIGKWRKLYSVPNVVECQDNSASVKLSLPSKNNPMDPTVGDIPNIAIATGGLDSLECLLLRMGVDKSEYTNDPAGMSPAGQIKIFPGYNGASMPGPSAVPSQQLWDSVPDLSRYDVVLLSCEGRETVDGPTQGATSLLDTDRQNLLSYSNMGGKVFASHYHYAWFNSGPFYTATNPPFATWLTGSNSIDDSKSFGAQVQTNLNNGSGMFPEGVAMKQWLGNVGALDNNGEVQIFQTRHNVSKINSVPGVQTWLTLDQASPVPGAVEYFSIDAPIGAVSTESACGRVVYSDLHVSGGPGMGVDGQPPDYPNTALTIVPDQCAMHPLTPQEKALEFMIFDLSSCLVPPNMPPKIPMTF